MLEELTANCPYCGETIELLIDITGGDQHYFEDCQVCCRPISVSLTIDGNSGEFRCEARRDDD